MRVIIAIFLILSSFQVGNAQHFTVDAAHHRAYSLLLDLKFEEAAEVIRQSKAADPKNLAPVHLEDLSDFLFIVVTEDLQQFEARKELRSARLKRLSGLPSASPYRLLAEGEIHLHWAFSMMRFGEYLNGAREINKAFKSLESNIQKHPDFLPTYKSMGLLHTLIGTVPDNYRWATKLMGVDGTIEQGIGEMERVIRLSEGKTEHKNLRKETLFLLSFLHINLLNDSEALGRYQGQVEKETGPLMDFAKASLHREAGRTDKAIEVLQAATAQNSSFPYLNFLLGEMKLARMDKDANIPLQKYANSFKGNSYKKATYQKLAWHALLVQNDEEKYRKTIAKIASVGNTMLDEDKSAQKEFESGQFPNKILLKARLQFDGGYYTKALSTLISSKGSDISTEDENLEFTYRLARIHHELGNVKEAVSYYEMTMKNGRDSKRYFAANSSLMLGLLYENRGEKAKAKQAFEASSSFNNTEYRNSITQKAKAGLMRLAD